jgi:hypothetical protein
VPSGTTPASPTAWTSWSHRISLLPDAEHAPPGQVPWLLKCKASKSYNVAHAATRALVHVLAVHVDPTVVEGYGGPEAEEAQGAVKSLLKQKADSDAED